tara:strand:- start:454 stop:630 length:177 start_codon:yes stop_codon:yes gene_type:complete
MRQKAWILRIVFISLAILVTYLVIRETLVPDRVPQVEYTFHGHEITVEELEDNDIIQH